MNHAPTFYETLGLQSNAVLSEIKLAHRKLAQQNHPDKVHHLANEFPWVEQEAAHRFKRITEAFHVLINTKARSRYDAELHKRRPEFISMHASPIYNPGYDPGRDRPETEAPQKSAGGPTRVSQTYRREPARAADHPMHRYSIPTESPFHQTEPRAERRRKNLFVSTLAFLAMLAVIYAALQNQLLNQITSDWVMQHANGPNAVEHSSPAVAPAFPLNPSRKAQ